MKHYNNNLFDYNTVISNIVERIQPTYSDIPDDALCAALLAEKSCYDVATNKYLATGVSLLLLFNHVVTRMLHISYSVF